MTRRFVVSTDAMTAEQEKQFKSSLPAGIGWWHWLPNFWLLVDSTDELTASEVRDKIYTATDKQVRTLVLQVEHKAWSALTRKDSKGRDMAKWINDDWTKK